MAAKRILIVDDNTAVASMTAAMVRTMGHSPVITWNNKSALAMWREIEGAFDMAVVDYLLPDGSGADLAEKLLAQKPAIQIILVSGMTEDNVDVPRGVRFLGKPFSLDELRRAVEARG